MLPEVKQVIPQVDQFPARWQTVIFRNYRMAPAEHIARVLGCAVEDVHREAARLGLRAGEHDPRWLTKGYITLIRNNWYLLPYEQLLVLLDFTEEQLAFSLEKDDFLDVKLGRFKPACDRVNYAPLTEEQEEHTARIAKTVRRLDISNRVCFDFFSETAKSASIIPRKGGGVRLVHGYLTPCGDAFLEDTRSHLPDFLLDRYAEQGVNALFIHGVLSSLSPYPFDPTLSRDYPTRRAHLRDLVERAGKRGVRIYLYMNEPRALPEAWFGSRVDEELMGHREGGHAALCLQTQGAREYLYNAVKDLFKDIPALGGILSITKSENFTHCTYGRKCNCPRCASLPIETMPAVTNNIMMQAIRDSGSDAELIANLCGWSPFMGWTREQTAHALEILYRDIAVMGISEYDLAIEKGGVQERVIDYSISNPGPSEVTRESLQDAARAGHKIYAKMQVNCSWECSAVPYLPVFDLELEHLQNLTQIGVNDLMLTWTLGGYPSITYDLIADYLEDSRDFSTERWYIKQFGENAAEVHRAVELFCRGFREYPFSLSMLYNSPKNLGPANLWSLAPEEKRSTMVCYAFDDYETWIRPYPLEVYLRQFEKVIADWSEGCAVLRDVVHDFKTEEMYLFAHVALLHFRADLIHTRYAHAKRDLTGNRDELVQLIEQEREVTAELLKLTAQSPLIGYETSNHYFYTERDLIEKLLQLDQMQEQLSSLY